MQLHYRFEVENGNLAMFNSVVEGSPIVKFASSEYHKTNSPIIRFSSNCVLLRTNDGYNLEDILQIFGIEYSNIFEVEGLTNTYVLELVEKNAVNMANFLFETEAFVYAQPSFYYLIPEILNTTTASTLDQWDMGSIHDGIYGINAVSAWGITTGNSSIKVAELDDGIQLDHPDLQNNLLTGYDATDGYGCINPGSSAYDNHIGTQSAGIIAGVNNSIGIDGVAYSSK